MVLTITDIKRITRGGCIDCIHILNINTFGRTCRQVETIYRKSYV